MTLSEAVERMRGPVDSKIDLRVLRKGGTSRSRST